MAVVERFIDTNKDHWEVRKVAIIGMWLLSRGLYILKTELWEIRKVAVIGSRLLSRDFYIL